MARGRKPDGPALQDAKGNPGKRLSRSRRTDKRAAALAANDPLSPPDFLREAGAASAEDAGLREALTIWRELAVHLQRRNLLDQVDRYAFARWCVYQAEWIEATRTINREGMTRVVETVSGDKMPRRHPAATHRDRIELSMQKLEAAYGLTPADRYRVMRDQAAAPLDGLFKPSEGQQPATPSPQPVAVDPVGFLGRTRPEPGQRPN